MDKQIKNTAKIRRTIIWSSTGVIIVALVIYQLAFADHSSKFNVDRDKLTISVVVEDEFQDYMSSQGYVEPIETVFLDPDDGGRIDRILIEEGNMIEEGDIILELSNANLRLQVAQAQAQFAEQENRLRDTKLMMVQQKLEVDRQILNYSNLLHQSDRNYRRNKIFYDKEMVSEEEFLVAKESYELALKNYEITLERAKGDSISREGQVKKMERTLKNIEGNLEIVKDKIAGLKVKAPISGLLATLNAEVGQVVGRGTQLGQVHDLSAYQIRALIDEHFLDRIRKGLNANFERNNFTFQLVIKKVYPEVRNGQFRIDLDFRDSIPSNIRTGQQYRMKIELGQPKTSLLLPQGGFYASTGGQWVYVLSEDETYAYKRDISTGRKNPRYFEIIEGLKPGEKVITSSYDNFGDNDKLIF